jgi:flagellar hook-length control protein FliK
MPTSGSTSAAANAPAAASASVAGAEDANSQSQGNKDFVAMLTQLLSGDAAAESNLPPTINQTKKCTDDSSSGDDLLSGLMVTPDSPLVADLSQALAGAIANRTVSQTDTTAIQANGRANIALNMLAGAPMQGAQVNASADGAGLLADVLRQPQLEAKATLDAAASLLDNKGGDAGTNKQSSTIDGANALGMQANAVSPQSIEDRAALHVQERVGTPAWRDEIGAKLNWMIDRGIQSGSLRLTPDNLGPLEVRITVQNDQVSVWFGAAHADTRAALENALPKLRDMFAAQGMSLADAGVFREPPRDPQQNRQDPTRAYNGSGDGAFAGALGITSGSATLSDRIRMLDAYA